MPTPFPGMDPYLERPSMWPGVHNALMAAIQLDLAPQVRPRYYVSLEERVYFSEGDDGRDPVGIPDAVVVGPTGNGGSSSAAQAGPEYLPKGVAMTTVHVGIPVQAREAYLELRDTGTGSVVTVIELLSPSNKRPGKGRDLYERKRARFLETWTHMVEVDLTRAGEPMRFADNGAVSDYRILIRRGGNPRATLYTFGVRHAIPAFRLPLKRGDAEPVLDIGKLLHELYDRAGYDLALDYASEPTPPLSPVDAEWADALFEEKGLR